MIITGDRRRRLDNFAVRTSVMSNYKRSWYGVGARQTGRMQNGSTPAQRHCRASWRIASWRLGLIPGGRIIEEVQSNPTRHSYPQPRQGARTETQRADKKFRCSGQRYCGEKDQRQSDQVDSEINGFAWFAHRSKHIGTTQCTNSDASIPARNTGARSHLRGQSWMRCLVSSRCLFR